MSSLREKEMQKVLFRPEGQRLVEFIEIVELEQGRHFLCVSVPQSKEVQICIVRCQTKKSPKSESKGCHTKRSRLEDSYKRTEVWSLQDLTQIDGRDPDIDDPCFLMHFDKARVVTAITCSAKYALVRTLVVLSDRYCQRKVKLTNFDLAYIKPTCNYTNRGDCVVLMQFCFYACNLVCLSMCPVPMD